MVNFSSFLFFKGWIIVFPVLVCMVLLAFPDGNSSFFILRSSLIICIFAHH